MEMRRMSNYRKRMKTREGSSGRGEKGTRRRGRKGEDLDIGQKWTGRRGRGGGGMKDT